MEKAIVVLKKTQFIKNVNLPTCIECLYYMGNKSSKCSKFGEKDIITGKIAYGSATEIRLKENLCGIKGNYFERI